MKVKDIMETRVVTIHKDATYEEAARILYANRLSGAPVVDRNGYLVGMLSEKDLFRVLYPYYNSFNESPELYLDYEARESKAHDIRDHKVETFMAKNIVSVEPETPVLHAGAIMLARQISRLPVVTEKQVVGMITREVIYRAILKQNFDL
jgi:CBS domain-containing protein